jgi:hypothetical protein
VPCVRACALRCALETTEEKRECLPKTQKRHSTMHDGPQIDTNRPSSPHSAESEHNGGDLQKKMTIIRMLV